METLRKCSKCLHFKPATAEFFHRQTRNPSGLHTECKACRLLRQKQYVENNPEQRKITYRTWARRLREKVLTHYSKGIPCCACCGERHIEFLALDHINGGGNQHRRDINPEQKYEISGQRIYQWVKAQGLPEGFQVLCHNCNMAKGAYGKCPHESEKKY